MQTSLVSMKEGHSVTLCIVLAQSGELNLTMTK